MNNEEADTYEELARQANHHQAKLDISTLCLSVLGGKAAEVTTKAISKCLKEKNSECKSESQKMDSTSAAPKPEDSPLHNLYPQYQVPPFMYSMPSMPFLQTPYFGNYQSCYRGRRRQQGFRPRGPVACLFCNSTTRLVKDCEKMKAAKGK